MQTAQKKIKRILSASLLNHKSRKKTLPIIYEVTWEKERVGARVVITISRKVKRKQSQKKTRKGAQKGDVLTFVKILLVNERFICSAKKNDSDNLGNKLVSSRKTPIWIDYQTISQISQSEWVYTIGQKKLFHCLSRETRFIQ